MNRYQYQIVVAKIDTHPRTQRDSLLAAVLNLYGDQGWHVYQIGDPQECLDLTRAGRPEETEYKVYMAKKLGD